MLLEIHLYTHLFPGDSVMKGSSTIMQQCSKANQNSNQQVLIYFLVIFLYDLFNSDNSHVSISISVNQC